MRSRLEKASYILIPHKSRASILNDGLLMLGAAALIAVIIMSNHQIAQTRSNITRTYAELQVFERALEIYAVDHFVYPFDLDSRGWNWYPTDVLSTPIAYLPNLDRLQDPFRQGHSNIPPAGKRYRYINYPANRGPNAWDPCPFPGPFTERIAPVLTDFIVDSGIGNYGEWRISSAGPDQSTSLSFISSPIRYDPTNGVISEGDLIWSKKR